MRMMLSAAQISVQCCTKYWHITGHQGSIRQHFSQSLWNVEGRLWMEYWLRQMQPWWKQTCRQHKHRYFKREEQRQAGSSWNSNWEKLQTMCTTLHFLSLSLSFSLNMTKPPSFRTRDDRAGDQAWHKATAPKTQRKAQRGICRAWRTGLHCVNLARQEAQAPPMRQY